MPLTTCTPAASSSRLCSTCITTWGSSCDAAVVRLFITSGIRSGDITETMLVRWRKAARTVAACVVIIGDPSSAHLGAATAVARSAMSIGLPAIASSRCCARSSNTALCAPTIDSTIDRQRSSRLAGSGTSRSSRASIFS